MNFKNERFVIIGGSSGMGLALARKVVQEGGKVVLCGRSSAKLQAAVAELGDHRRWERRVRLFQKWRACE